MKVKCILLMLVVLMMGSTALAATEMFIASMQRGRVTKFDVDTKVQNVWWSAALSPNGTGWMDTSNDKQSLFVASSNWNGAGATIQQVSVADGSIITTIDNTLVAARGVVQDAAGDVYGCQYDGAIYKYDASASWARSLIHAAGADGLTKLASLDIGPDGNLYTLDVQAGGTGTVHKLALDGTYIGLFKDLPGPGPYPFMIEFGPNGNLYAATGNQHSVQEFDGAGTMVREYTDMSMAFDATSGIGFHPITGNMFVSMVNVNKIHEFNTTTGAYVGLFTDNTDAMGLLGDIEIIPEPATMLLLGLGGLLLRRKRA